jgi:hypothetical protein
VLFEIPVPVGSRRFWSQSKGRLSKTLFMTRVEPNSCCPRVGGWVDLAGDHSG